MNSLRDFIIRQICYLKQLFSTNKKKSKKLIHALDDPRILALSVRSKTRKKVASEFDICVKTLNRWFADNNLDIPRGRICCEDLRLIYATLGIPKEFM